MNNVGAIVKLKCKTIHSKRPSLDLKVVLPLEPAFNVYKVPTTKCNLKGTKKEATVTSLTLFIL
jgi:hypothetical protein